jgi:hypothetical protein
MLPGRTSFWRSRRLGEWRWTLRLGVAGTASALGGEWDWARRSESIGTSRTKGFVLVAPRSGGRPRKDQGRRTGGPETRLSLQVFYCRVLERSNWFVPPGDTLPESPIAAVMKGPTSDVRRTMKETFTVFYAWQSDHPGGHCRYLVAEALEAAAKAISDDPSIPFRIEIDQDTKGVPGLCDIPATILAKIQKSDALVGDLTYIAHTTVDPPRSCSNPNVLFEVGFAFHAISPERLILVMNEHYGPTTNQIFDLDHRRHPIGFKFPDDQSRSVTVNQLAKNLENALRPIVALGQQARDNGQIVDDQVKEVQRLRSELEVLSKDMHSDHWWVGAIYPIHFRRRWDRLNQIEKALHDRKARGNDGHEFPPQTKGNTRQQWGITNSLYGEPWIAATSGVFLYKAPMDHSQSPFPQRTWQPSDRGKKQQIEPGKWVDIKRWRESIVTFFDFAHRWTIEFSPQEEVTVALSAHIEGLHLVASGTTLERYVEDIEPSSANEYRFSRTLRAAVFQAEWTSICVEAIDAFVELFPPTMGHEFPSSKEWVESQKR